VGKPVFHSEEMTPGLTGMLSEKHPFGLRLRSELGRKVGSSVPCAPARFLGTPVPLALGSTAPVQETGRLLHCYDSRGTLLVHDPRICIPCQSLLGPASSTTLTSARGVRDGFKSGPIPWVASDVMTRIWITCQSIFRAPSNALAFISRMS
jgi:hypothetical protein